MIRRLVDGEKVIFEGRHVHVNNASIDPAIRSRLPILVGVTAPRALRMRARLPPLSACKAWAAPNPMAIIIRVLEPRAAGRSDQVPANVLMASN